MREKVVLVRIFSLPGSIVGFTFLSFVEWGHSKGSPNAFRVLIGNREKSLEKSSESSDRINPREKHRFQNFKKDKQSPCLLGSVGKGPRQL